MVHSPSRVLMLKVRAYRRDACVTCKRSNQLPIHQHFVRVRLGNLAMRLVLRHGSKGAAAHNQRCLLRQEFVGGNAGVFGLRIFRITGRGLGWRRAPPGKRWSGRSPEPGSLLYIIERASSERFCLSRARASTVRWGRLVGFCAPWNCRGLFFATASRSKN
jgi:hypothetical protein